MNPKEKYWFYLEPYVFVDIKENTFILYNTLDKSSIIGNDRLLLNLIKSVVNPTNCGVVSLVLEENSKIPEFIWEIRNKFMGDIIPHSSSSKKPIQPLPLAHLKENIQTYNLMDHSSDGVDVVKYLSEISIYIHTKCKYNCNYCHLYYKQFPCCTKSTEENKDVLDLALLDRFVKSLIEANFDGTINIFAGDYLLDEQYINNLLTIFQPLLKSCYFYYHVKIISHTPITQLDIPMENIRVIVDSSITKELLLVLKNKLLKNIILIISSKEDYDKFDKMFNGESSFELKMEPFYTGNNLDFFKKYIYLNKKDILAGVKDMQYIHQNIILNTNFFGKIIVFPNGNVYSNINNKLPIGNLENSIAKIVYNAMFSKGSLWMKTRGLPLCKKCIFQHLCPPVSNYESTLKNKPLCYKNK